MARKVGTHAVPTLVTSGAIQADGPSNSFLRATFPGTLGKG
jgi:hypothetical protein